MAKKIKIHYFLLIIILLISFFLRFYQIRDYLIFLGDQGRDVLIVKKMLVDGKFTLLGPVASVGGFYLGPFYYYLIAPFLFLSNYDPIGPAIFVAVLGGFLPLGVYFLVYKRISVSMGVLASFLSAISPVLVKYNRFSWNPNVVPFFSFVFFIFLAKCLIQKKIRDALFCGIFLGILFQLHYLTFSFVPVIVVLLIYFMRFSMFAFKQLLMIFLGVMLGWFPFILYEIRHQLQNFIGLLEFISRKDGTNIGFDYSRYFRTFFDNLYSINDYLFNLPVLLNWAIVFIILFGIVRLIQNKNNQFARVLGMFVLISLITLSFYKGKMGEHYFNMLYVFILMVMAYMLAFLFETWKKTAIGLLFMVVIAFYSAKDYPFWHEPNHQLDQTIEISKFIMSEYVRGDSFNFALLTNMNSDHAYRYFFDLWGNAPIEILNDVIDPQRKTVTQKLIVLCEPLTSCPDPRGYSLWEIAAFGRSEIVSRRVHGVYTIYEMKHWSGEKIKI